MSNEKEKINKEDLPNPEIGMRYGALVIVEEVRRPLKSNPNRTEKMFVMKCDCGGSIEGRPADIKRGLYKKCKTCKELEPNPIEIGTRFGSLTTTSNGMRIRTNNGAMRLFYDCKCDCGNTTRVSKGNLTSGNIKSCGCSKLADIKDGGKAYSIKRLGKGKCYFEVGEKIGRLTIKERTSNADYICDCECGAKDVLISKYNLDTSMIPSCGCSTRLGTVKFKIKHPEILPFIDRAKAILDRCRHPKDGAFHNYGGRGIKCLLGNTQTEVAYALSLVPGYKDGYEIDRIDGNGDYTLFHPKYGLNVYYSGSSSLGKDVYESMGNLRWVPRSENVDNIKLDANIHNRLRTMNGIKHYMSRWGDDINDYIMIEADFANQDRFSNCYIGDEKLYVCCHKDDTEEFLHQRYNDIKSYYEKWKNYKDNDGYNYYLSEHTTKESFLEKLVERSDI